MIKKALAIIGISSFVTLSACTNQLAQDDHTIRDSLTPTRVNSPTQLYDEDYRRMKNDSEDFGFIRLQKTGVNQMNRFNNRAPGLDREQLADVISHLCLQLPGIEDVSTLVTDEEVLIVYDTKEKNRFESADQVKKAALSVVPRYFHVYVSDNPSLAQNIENYATLETGSPNVESMISKTIEQMKKSPQGRKISKVENENGEMKDEQNGMK